MYIVQIRSLNAPLWFSLSTSNYNIAASLYARHIFPDHPHSDGELVSLTSLCSCEIGEAFP